MNNLIIGNRLPTAKQYNELRNIVGARTFDINLTEIAIKNSLYFVTVFDNENLVGMARVIGDGAITFYIQDVVIHPDYQGKNLGRKLMEKINLYLEQFIKKEQEIYVGLMAVLGKENFYEKFGFVKRPNDFLGAGMTKILKEEK